MGIFSDTLEDNRERYYELWPIEPLDPVIRKQLLAPIPPTFPCPACFAAYASAKALDEHLFRSHAASGFFLRINDQVAAATTFVTSLKQLSLVPLGAEPVFITVNRRDRVDTITASPGTALNLMSYVDSKPPIELSARVAGRQRSYRIYVGTAPQLDFPSLDSLVVTAQAPLLRGEKSRWRDLAGEGMEPLAGAYLRGFAEYLLAVNLELFDTDLEAAARRYEAAYGALRSYNSRLARTLCAVVEFRMNAFERLLKLGPHSIFWSAANYFQSPARLVAPSQNRSHRASESGIWVDNTQDSLLDAVEYVLSGELGKALAKVRALTPGDLQQPGNSTKTQIITARVYDQLGNRDAARAAFRELIGDPMYDGEARQVVGN